MNTFKSLVLAASLAIAPGIALSAGSAFAAAQTTAAAAGPTKAQYDGLHQATTSMFTQYLAALSDAENAARLTQLPIEMGKLPGFEQAYVEAKKAGKEDDAKAAAASYAATAQRVIDLAMPLDELVGGASHTIGTNLGQLGPVAQKLLAEKDVVDIQEKIKKALEPLLAANKLIGPMHDNAEKAAAVRVELVQKQFFTEELAHQVDNYLQGKLAQ